MKNLRFAHGIDGLARQEQELVKLINHLEEASTAYGMHIQAEKTVLMTNNTNGISADIAMDNKKLETVRKSHLERQEHSHQLQDQTDAFPGHVHTFVCM